MATMTADQITEKQFKAFVKVRDSGKTNMWDRNAVFILSHGVVGKEEHVAIITHFEKLQKKYPKVDKRGK